jgi:hypothetical protein
MNDPRSPRLPAPETRKSEPRTAAGRRLLTGSVANPNEDRAWLRDAILAIEAEASSPDELRAALDVDVLAEALKRAEVGCLGFGGFHNGNDPDVHHRQDAEVIARKYAALHASRLDADKEGEAR